MDAEMLRNVLTMLGTVLGAILVLMLVAKITSMVHVEADDARAPIDSMEASVVGKRTLVTQEDGAPKTIYYMTPITLLLAGSFTECLCRLLFLSLTTSWRRNAIRACWSRAGKNLSSLSE